MPSLCFLACFLAVLRGVRGQLASSQAPFLPQSSYTFTSSCSPGSTIGQITVSNTGGTVIYSADPGVGSPFNVNVNAQSGLITLASPSNSNNGESFQFSFRATNQYGSVAAPVSVICNGLNGNFYNSYGSTVTNNLYNNNGYNPYSSYPYGTNTNLYGYNPYAYGTNYLNSYPYGTNTIGTYPYYGTSSYPYYGSTGFGSNVIYGTPITGTTGTVTQPVTPVFARSSYQFTVGSCGATSVGQVTASNASTYTVQYGGNNFTVDGSGNISAVAGLTPGTYALTVTATSSTGTQVAVPVSVVVSCNTG